MLVPYIAESSIDISRRLPRKSWKILTVSGWNIARALPRSGWNIAKALPRLSGIYRMSRVPIRSSSGGLLFSQGFQLTGVAGDFLDSHPVADVIDFHHSRSFPVSPTLLFSWILPRWLQYPPCWLGYQSLCHGRVLDHDAYTWTSIHGMGATRTLMLRNRAPESVVTLLPSRLSSMVSSDSLELILYVLIG